MTAILPDNLTALDWDFTPSCELEHCPDAPPAEWRLTFICGCTRLCCDPCAEAIWEELASYSDHWRGRATCKVCGWTGFVHYRDAIRLRRLS